MSATAVDKAARGWARVPSPGACSFCLMLAIRAGAGFLYRTAETANFRAHHVQPNGSGGECRCGVEPVWGRYEPTAAVRAAQRLWTDSTAGRTGADARAAFRQAVEGRPVTGTSRTPGHKPSVKPSGPTLENQAAQLRLLEAMPPAKTPEAAAWRVARMAEIRSFLGS